jgi:hypothetical protein
MNNGAGMNHQDNGEDDDGKEWKQTKLVLFF